MKPIEPLELRHSWPLFERGLRFDLGATFDIASDDPFGTAFADAALAPHGFGLFDCLLADSRLTWSAAVYDLFGLPRGAIVTRPETLALYADHSRATLERLRAHALRHRRGFTMDAELRPATGGPRWMRLTAAPVVEGGRLIRLQGVKRDVTDEYL